MAYERGRIYRFSDFTLEVSEHRLRRGQDHIALQPKPFDVLLYLVERHGHLIKKSELLDTVWADTIVAESALTNCIKEVRKALGDDASRPSFIRTIHRLGYEFVAEVEEIKSAAGEEAATIEEYTAMRVIVSEAGEGAVVSSESADSAESAMVVPADGQPVARSGRLSEVLFQRKKRVYLIGGAASLLVLLVVAGLYFFSGRVEAINSVAVLPLVYLSGDPEPEYFADGMTEALISDLGKIGALRVISRTSVMQYKGVMRPLPEAARELNVDAVVEGSVARSGERVRITAKLIHAATDRLLWTKSYERNLGDTLALQSEVARAIAQEINITLTPQEQKRLTRRTTENKEAYEAYLKGRYFWNKFTVDGVKKGIEYFQQAIEKDPNYALAYAGLADSYNILGNSGTLAPKVAYPTGKTNAEKALEIDEALGEAHNSLAWARLLYDWDWLGAEREFKRAIELNPSYTNAHEGYAHYFAAMGRFDEALAEIERARQLDPLSLITNTSVGSILVYAHKYDQAIEQLRKTLEMDPRFLVAVYFLTRAYVQKGMYEEARAEMLKASTLREDSMETVAAYEEAYESSGMTGVTRLSLDRLKELSNREHVSSFDLAALHVFLGEKDQAFAQLEEACEERFWEMTFLNVDPRLDSLRSDPRFQDLLRCVGFPP